MLLKSLGSYMNSQNKSIRILASVTARIRIADAQRDFITNSYSAPVSTVTPFWSAYRGIHFSHSDEPTVPQTNYNEVKDLVKSWEKLIIDVREPKELKETGRIPRSINIPEALIEEELSPNTDDLLFKQKYGFSKPKTDTEIIFYCRSGKRAQKAALVALELGYTNVKNYVGSWTDWAEREGLSK